MASTKRDKRQKEITAHTARRCWNRETQQWRTEEKYFLSRRLIFINCLQALITTPLLLLSLIFHCTERKTPNEPCATFFSLLFSPFCIFSIFAFLIHLQKGKLPMKNKPTRVHHYTLVCTFKTSLQLSSFHLLFFLVNFFTFQQKKFCKK